MTDKPIPLVLIHGVGLDRHLWDTVSTLMPGRHVITYDLLGHGRGPHPVGPYSLDMFVDQLSSIVDGYPMIDLCGFSLGALIAQGFAVAHPNRVRRLVTLATVFRRTHDEQRAISARVDEVRARGFLRTVDAALDRWFSPEFTAQHPDAVADIRTTMQCNDARAYADAYAVFAVADTELAPFISQITVPTLAVTGSDDPRSTPAMSEAFAAAVGDGRCVIIQGSRHCCMVEQPATVAHLLDEFLDAGTPDAVKRPGGAARTNGAASAALGEAD